MKSLHILAKRTVAIIVLSASLNACKKDISSVSAVLPEETTALAVSSNRTIITQITFTATAAIAYCHGENIIFTGTIENKVNTTVDNNGIVHYTRHWIVKGLTGTGVSTGTIYDVTGGAEMFSVKNAVLNSNGTLNLPSSLTESDIVIHEGTVVFVSRTDRSRVVARHVIRKVPGSDTILNEWICSGN